MSKKPKLAVDTVEINLGNEMEKKAVQLAGMLDTAVSPIVDGLAIAKSELHGGPFVVMRNVIEELTKLDYDLKSLPDPAIKTGNNPAYYKIKVQTAKSVTMKEVFFYDQVGEAMPFIRGCRSRIDQLNRSMAKDKSKVKTDDLDDALLNRPIANRDAEVKRLTTKISVGKGNIAKAFELYHQIMKFRELEKEGKIKLSIAYEVGDDGKLCDGKEGRPYRVEKINSPLTVRSALEGREDLDKGSYSVDSFLKFDIPKAQESVGGATFVALERTLAREPTSPPPATGQVPINTLPTLVKSVNECAAFIYNAIEVDTSKAKWDAVVKYLQAGTEEGKTDQSDFLFSLAYIALNTKFIWDNPRTQVWYQAQLDKRDDKKKVA